MVEGAKVTLLPAAVIGSPVSHSLSPVLHKSLYDYLGQGERDYLAIDVPLADFPRFWAEQDRAKWQGFSVTMPLKEAAASACDELHAAAAEIFVANTVVFELGRAHGYNTDVSGLIAIVEELRLNGASTDSVVILGSGASAMSAALAVRTLGVHAVRIAARRQDAATQVGSLLHDGFAGWVRLAGDDDRITNAAVDAICESTLVISTLPLAVAGEVGAAVAAAAGKPMLGAGSAVIELGYGSGVRSFADHCVAAGGLVVDGREFLVQQGVDQLLLHLGATPGEEAALVGVEPQGPELRRALVDVGRRALSLV